MKGTRALCHRYRHIGVSDLYMRDPAASAEAVSPDQTRCTGADGVSGSAWVRDQEPPPVEG